MVVMMLRCLGPRPRRAGGPVLKCRTTSRRSSVLKCRTTTRRSSVLKCSSGHGGTDRFSPRYGSEGLDRPEFGF